MSEPPEFDGYDEPYKFPANRFRDTMLSSVLLIVSFVVISEELTSGLRSLSFYISFLIENKFSVLVLLIIGLVTTAEFHERSHRMVAALLGLDPVIVRNQVKLASFVTFPGQTVERGQNIVFIATPFFTVNLVGTVVLIASLHPVITALGAALFVMNTSFASLDLYAVWYENRLPDGSIFYYSADSTDLYPWIFELASSTENWSSTRTPR